MIKRRALSSVSNIERVAFLQFDSPDAISLYKSINYGAIAGDAAGSLSTYRPVNISSVFRGVDTPRFDSRGIPVASY